MTARVVGLDLSLGSTGIGLPNTTIRVEPKDPPAKAPIEHPARLARIEVIREAVMRVLAEQQPELVVVEGPIPGGQGRGEHERGGLWWVIRREIADAGVPLRVAAPSMLKKYATGKGSGKDAGKDQMILATARRFDWFTGNNDEADALWACALGYEFLGEPLVQMPAVNREALRTWLAVAA